MWLHRVTQGYACVLSTLISQQCSHLTPNSLTIEYVCVQSIYGWMCVDMHAIYTKSNPIWLYLHCCFLFQVLDESANKALQLLNERYVSKVITCEKQQQQQQANELSNDTDSVVSGLDPSLSTGTIPTDPSPLIHSFTHTHPILINSHA